jgi:DNA-binding NarL/FixJ family response regulator
MANRDTPLSSVRVLVVDDFKQWRQWVCSLLETRPEICVVAEAGDGLEAVQKAQELKPDLILLDIGLPSLNGIEVAKRIRQVAPNAGIIFLTLNSDKEIVRAALSTGAQGYVLKTDASRDLLPALARFLAVMMLSVVATLTAVNLLDLTLNPPDLCCTLSRSGVGFRSFLQFGCRN